MSGKLYKGKYTDFSAQVGCYENGKIYRGRDTFSSAQIGCYENGKVFRGKYPDSSKQVGCFENGKIFRGKYPDSSKQVGCFENGKIYRGRDTFSSDQVGCYEGTGDGAIAASFLLLSFSTSITIGGYGASFGASIFVILIVAIVILVQWIISMLPFVIAGIVIFFLIRKLGFAKSIMYIFITIVVAVLAFVMFVRNKKANHRIIEAENQKQQAELSIFLAPFTKILSKESSTENPDVKSIVGEHTIHRLRPIMMDTNISSTLSDKDASVDPLVIITSRAPELIYLSDLENPKYSSLGQTITIQSTSKRLKSNCYSLIDKIDKYHLFISTNCLNEKNEVSSTDFGIIEVERAVQKKLKFNTPVNAHQLPKETWGLWTSGAQCTKEIDNVIFVGGNSILGKVTKEDGVLSEDINLFGIQKLSKDANNVVRFTALSSLNRGLALCVLDWKKESKDQKFSGRCSTDYAKIISEEGLLPEEEISALNRIEQLDSREYNQEFNFTLCSPVPLKKPPKRQKQ